MKKQHIKLTAKDRKILELKLSKETLSAKVRKRILGLQALDRGLSYQAAKKELKTSHTTLATWAKKYKENGLRFLQDQPRSGRPQGLSVEDRAKVTALACTQTPDGYGKWSLRLLADKLVELEYVEKISHTKVSQILKKTNLSLTSKNNGVSEL